MILKKRKELIEKIRVLVNKISFFVFSQNFPFVERIIDQKKEEEIKLLRRWAKKARICPICLSSLGRIHSLKNYGTKEHPIIMCHSCSYTEKR